MRRVERGEKNPVSLSFNPFSSREDTGKLGVSFECDLILDFIDLPRGLVLTAAMFLFRKTRGSVLFDTFFTFAQSISLCSLFHSFDILLLDFVGLFCWSCRDLTKGLASTFTLFFRQRSLDLLDLFCGSGLRVFASTLRRTFAEEKS